MLHMRIDILDSTLFLRAGLKIQTIPTIVGLTWLN